MEVIVKKIFSVLFVMVFLSCGSEDSSSASGEESIAAEYSSVSGANLDDQIVKQSDNSGENTDEMESDAAPLEEAPVAYLELCYATSINMPEDLYGPENVFDGDSSTYWATMPGAAPDEGLYFSFDEPVNIRNIVVETVPGSSEYEEVEYVQLYINGLEGAERRPGTTISSYGPVKSVFVKITDTESIKRDEQGIRYQRDVPVAISEIRITVRSNSGDEVPMRIVPISEAEGSVEASSSLEPVEAYGPDFLFDSRPAFGWADGNENSTGEGESLTFRFDEPQYIEQLLIWDGYHRSRVHFEHNERASLISFGVEGETPVEYKLDDTMTPQVVYLDSPLEGNDFTMDFLEVYPGEAYRDLVVSELRFFDGDEWFGMETGGSEERKLEILEWARNCDAGAFIDKQIFTDYSEDYYYNEQSIIIRSNGSFVIWKVDERSDSRERMYADGNWQILDDSTIRIFGRLHRLAAYDQDSYDPYAGTWSDQDERLDRMTIFSDTLRFGEDWISSSKGIFEDFEF